MNTRRSHPHLRIVNKDEAPAISGDEFRVDTSNGTGKLIKTYREAAPVEKVKEHPRWRIYVSIMKPITWVPVIWSFWCGAASSGGLRWDTLVLVKLFLGLLLSGPLLCGMSQAINDYFDREVDAVNEPNRALPSQRITIFETFRVIACLGFLGLGAAYFLGGQVMILSLAGIALAHFYSAPPVRLKRFTWVGPYTSATAYVMLPWLAATSVFGEITWRTIFLTLVFTFGAMGIMISNDFKSIRGDYKLKLPSVPVVYGIRFAAIASCAFIDLAQVVAIGFLLWEGHLITAGIIVLLILPQLYFQRHFIRKPLALAIWYNARSQNFYILGMLLTAWLWF